MMMCLPPDPFEDEDQSLGDDVRYARIRLRDPSGWKPDGSFFVRPQDLEWQEVPFVDPWRCGHEETMCVACWQTWNWDHEIELDEDIELPGELEEGQWDGLPDVADVLERWEQINRED